MNSMLPAPSPDALAHSQRVTTHLRSLIEDAGGWVPFSRFMEAALYAPGLGYYAAGAMKFGAAGDFVTAPEMTPLFGRTLAHAIAPVLAETGGEVLELGAGSGRLAADLLGELERLGALPAHYTILEVSADLRQRQQETIAREWPHLVERVRWLDALPGHFAGARPDPDDRLRLRAERVLPSATPHGHAARTLPPSRARRSVLPAWPVRPDRTRRLQCGGAGRNGSGACAGRLYQPGQFSAGKRAHRPSDADPARRCRGLPAAGQRGAAAGVTGRDGRTVQVDRVRQGRYRTPGRFGVVVRSSI